MDNSTKAASLLGSTIVSTRVTTMSQCFAWIFWPCLTHFDSICVFRRGIPFQTIWSQNPLPMEPRKCTSLFTSARCFNSILATSWCPPAADRCKAVHPAACWHRMFCHLTEDLTQGKNKTIGPLNCWGEERYVEGAHFEMQNAWNCLPSYMTLDENIMHMKIKMWCSSWCVNECCFWFAITSCPSCSNLKHWNIQSLLLRPVDLQTVRVVSLQCHRPWFELIPQTCTTCETPAPSPWGPWRSWRLRR